MEEPDAGDQPAFALPPGCRFHPSEDQLFGFYLMNKNLNPGPDDLCNAIKELDLYNHFPPELPDRICFPYGPGGGKRHWYCYTLGVASRKRRNRGTRGGFWRRRGSVKDVTVGGSGGNEVWGTRTRFVFYEGSSARTAIKTDWIMSEYALPDHFPASFVLCRVFVKANRGNDGPNNVKRSHGNNSGPQVPDLREELSINISIDCNISRGPMPVVSMLNSHVAPGPVSEAGSQFHMDNQLDERQLMSILEEDYIELDDLPAP